MKVRVGDGKCKVLMNLCWLWVMMKICGVGLVIRRWKDEEFWWKDV